MPKCLNLCSALWFCQRCRVNRSPPKGTRLTEEAQRQAPLLVAPGWRRQPEPRPVRGSSPQAGSARPRKNQRIKTNVLFCNIQRVRVSVRVSVLCICLSVRKRTMSPDGLDTQRAAPARQRRGEGFFFRERRYNTNGGSPAPKPLVPAIIYPQWNTDIRGWDNNNNYPETFTGGQTLLQVAQCTIFVMWGSRLSRWYVL